MHNPFLVKAELGGGFLELLRINQVSKAEIVGCLEWRELL